jgi:hypothetical protein
MGAFVVPQPAAGGGIKSVQRGVSSTAETVTITAVNVDKSFVTVFSDSASPTSSTINWASYNSQNQVTRYAANSASWGANWALSEYGAYLSGSTSLVTTGPCRWEVVEFA